MDLALTHLQRSLEAAQLLAVSTDERGRITFCNRALAQLIGASPEDLLHKDLFDEVLPLEEDRFDVDRFLSSIIHRRIAENTSLSLRTRSGKTIDTVIVSTILHQEGEQLNGLTIIAEDRSERAMVQQKLAQSNQLLDELYDSAFDLIQICDEQGHLLLVNRAWCDKLGYAPHEVAHAPFLDFVHPQYRTVAQTYWERVNEQDRGSKLRSVFVAQDGEPVHVSGSIVPRTDERGQKTYRGVFHDISDQVRAERARNLYNSIVHHTIHSGNLQDLFHNIFRELKKVVRAEDFGVALREKEAVDFSYWTGPHAYLVQEADHQVGLEDLANYAMSIGKPMFLNAADLNQLTEAGTIRPLRVLPSVWIGIPLVSQQQTVGLLFVQDQQRNNTLGTPDLELLDFVSGQVALAIDRKANEEKLSEQQSRQYAIFESSSHLVWSVDRDLRFTAFNRNFEKTFSAHYHVSPQLGHRYHPEHAPETQTYLSFWQEKYREAFRGQTTHFEAEFFSDEHTSSWQQVFVNPIYREDGSIREVSGIAHDITQRKKSEIALLDSEEKFRTIYESFQDIYFRCRLDGTLTMVSPSVNELTDYQTYDVLGKNITNYYLYDKRTKNLIRKLVKQRAVRNFEATIIKEDGELLQCICNVRLVDSLYGGPREIEGVARDITKLRKTNVALQRAKDEAERSLRIKEAFLANMSHEIRTPMNGILNMINLLANTSLDAKQREYVSTVQDSSETLLAILNDILDLSKIEAGKMTLQREAVAIRALLDKLYRLFSHQAEGQGVRFRLHIAEPVPPVLRVDALRLLQVLSNLTANAIKFTEPGGTVAVRVEVPDANHQNGASPEEHLVKVLVEDSGIGISEKDQRALFKNFSQVDASSSKRYQGTGLGLSIARQLVVLMGGEIGVDSAVGQGSTFWFTFRAEAAAAPTTTVTPEEKLSFVNPGPRVLVVDDNAINRRVAYEILHQAGATVTLAEGGAQAIARVQEQSFDVILMDIQMPVMNGIEATQRLRSLALPTLPPVVAMTAYSMDGDKDRFMEAGLDEYLSKPIRPDEMITRVATLTGHALRSDTTSEATLADGDTEAIINERVLQKLAKYGGPELVTESLRDFEEESEGLLDTVEEASQDQDYDTILKTLHTLKGNASTLGIDRVARHAKRIEQQLKEKKYGGLSEDLLILRTSFKEFQHTFHHNPNSQYHV